MRKIFLFAIVFTIALGCKQSNNTKKEDKTVEEGI